MIRRYFLQLAGASASLTALSGCQFVSGAVPDCLTGKRTYITFHSARHVEESREHIIPFTYSELSEDYPEIIEEIASDGQYERCSPLSEGAESFITSVEKRIARQFEEYDGEPSEGMEFRLSTAYVERDESIVEIYLYREGELISGDTLLGSPSSENGTTTNDS